MSKLLVLYVLLAVAFATPISISECGRLNKPFSTYKLTGDIAVRDDATVCFDITGKGITLDGNNFEINSASGAASSATGVRYSGEGVTVTNLRITNMRTGIDAKGRFGTVYNNVITRGTNGIDVSATNNLISSNKISNFQATDESTSGIYVYFPALVPADSYVNITNNVISDIQGSFAQGVSVYYANSVYIGQNRIYNIQGELMSQDIAVIEGQVDTFENVFTALPADGFLPTWASVLLTAVTLLLSYYFFRTSKVSNEPAPIVQQLEEKRKQIEMEMQKEKERREHEGIQDSDEDEFENDGADVVKVNKIQRFSLSSSISLLSSPIM